MGEMHYITSETDSKKPREPTRNIHGKRKRSTDRSLVVKRAYLSIL